MRHVASVLIPVLVGVLATMAGEPWKLAVESNLTLGLNTYSNNWTGGDVGTFSWAAQILATAEKQFAGKLNNKNTLKLAFGQTKTQDPENDQWSAPQKSSDLVDFESVLKFTLSGWVDPYISVHAVSQFLQQWYLANRSDEQHLYGNPVDFTESFGVSRDIVKKDRVQFASRLGGAFKQHLDRRSDGSEVVKDDGVEVVRRLTNDGGLESITDLKVTHPSDLLAYTSKLSLYEALFRVDAVDGEDAWRHPDINWENTLTVNFAKFIMINLSLQMLYDKEIDTQVRLKETLAAGLTYVMRYPKPPKSE